MNHSLHSQLARARTDELLREAARQRIGARAPAGRSLAARIAQATRRIRHSADAPPPVEPEGGASVSIRCARAEDEVALLRLAALDSAAALAGPVLVAELSGELLAALSLRDERAIADPSHRTADLRDLLRLRANQLAAADQQEISSRRQQWASPDREVSANGQHRARFQTPRPAS
jgi:hypothetical protein